MNEQSEKLKRIIVEQLQWDERVDESKINVEVISNTVRLTGTTGSFEAWRAAWRNAANVVGVAGVDNQLRIEYLPGLPTTRILEIQRSFPLRENTAMGGALWQRF